MTSIRADFSRYCTIKSWMATSARFALLGLYAEQWRNSGQAQRSWWSMEALHPAWCQPCFIPSPLVADLPRSFHFLFRAWSRQVCRMSGTWPTTVTQPGQRPRSDGRQRWCSPSRALVGEFFWNTARTVSSQARVFYTTPGPVNIKLTDFCPTHDLTCARLTLGIALNTAARNKPNYVWLKSYSVPHVCIVSWVPPYM